MVFSPESHAVVTPVGERIALAAVEEGGSPLAPRDGRAIKAALKKNGGLLKLICWFNTTLLFESFIEDLEEKLTNGFLWREPWPESSEEDFESNYRIYLSDLKVILCGFLFIF